MKTYEMENVESEKINTTCEVVGTLNHEVNNPLAALLGNVELLLMDNSLCIRTRSKLTQIRALSLRVRDVVRNFTENIYLNSIKYSNQIDMVDIRR
ncbi:MAG: histidine kinase dimerization/phospho-acceptor domain-containing protein [Candidatus Anammoxibacter sp.]